MTDLLLPTPASINSQECDCKWVRRPMGSSAERRARSIQQSRHLSLHRMACIGWIHLSHRSGPHQEHPAGYHTYHDEEDALVHHDLQRSGRLEDMPGDDRTGPLNRPARSSKNSPTYEEALLSLGRAPTWLTSAPMDQTPILPP